MGGFIAIPIILGLAIQLIGIQHGHPDKVYHPNVAKQTQVAIVLFSEGTVNLRNLYKDNIRFTMYPISIAFSLVTFL